MWTRGEIFGRKKKTYKLSHLILVDSQPSSFLHSIPHRRLSVASASKRKTLSWEDYFCKSIRLYEETSTSSRPLFWLTSFIVLVSLVVVSCDVEIVAVYPAHDEIRLKERKETDKKKARESFRKSFFVQNCLSLFFTSRCVRCELAGGGGRMMELWVGNSRSV